MVTRTDIHPVDPPFNDCILVINCGSSSVKYQVLNSDTETVFLKGMLEGIGLSQGNHDYFWLDETGKKNQQSLTLQDPDYSQGFAAIASLIKDSKYCQLSAIGHRVVHGGEDFIAPTLIDAKVLAKINKLFTQAPLHNPANVQGIRVCLDLFPGLPQVAVFDTAFHQTMPEYAYRYAIPKSWYEKHHIRKYGFHGSSHCYVANKAATYLQKPLANLNLITLHLGNGASIAAIEKGKCIDTSMGFTPLEGLLMGTRCGDIDPSIPLYMQQVTKMSSEQIGDQLNHHSGLLGLTGNQDMRELLIRSEYGEPESESALNMYCYRIKKYIGAYVAALGRVDAIIFTGGVGENAATIRNRCCQNLTNLGIAIDTDLNSQPVDKMLTVSPANNKVHVLIIRTNEELQIANDVINLISNYQP